jgi:hypothetical protein
MGTASDNFSNLYLFAGLVFLFFTQAGQTPNTGSLWIAFFPVYVPPYPDHASCTFGHPNCDRRGLGWWIAFDGRMLCKGHPIQLIKEFQISSIRKHFGPVS